MMVIDDNTFAMNDRVTAHMPYMLPNLGTASKMGDDRPLHGTVQAARADPMTGKPYIVPVVVEPTGGDAAKQTTVEKKTGEVNAAYETKDVPPSQIQEEAKSVTVSTKSEGAVADNATGAGTNDQLDLTLIAEAVIVIAGVSGVVFVAGKVLRIL